MYGLKIFSSWLLYRPAFLFRLCGMVVVVMLGRMVGQVVVSRVGNSQSTGNRRTADVRVKPHTLLVSLRALEKA